MSDSTLHEWLGTPEAARSCKIAVKVAKDLQGQKIRELALGDDELLGLARFFLTECAMPKPEAGPTDCAMCGSPLGRKGSKFCSSNCRVRAHREGLTIVAPPPAHIGSMWDWPEDNRVNFAARESGHRVANYVVTQYGSRRLETHLRHYLTEGSDDVDPDRMANGPRVSPNSILAVPDDNLDRVDVFESFPVLANEIFHGLESDPEARAREVEEMAETYGLSLADQRVYTPRKPLESRPGDYFGYGELPPVDHYYRQADRVLEGV